MLFKSLLLLTTLHLSLSQTLSARETCSLVDCNLKCLPSTHVDRITALIGDGICDNGQESYYNFQCEQYIWDMGDCKNGGERGYESGDAGLVRNELFKSVEGEKKELLDKYLATRGKKQARLSTDDVQAISQSLLSKFKSNPSKKLLTPLTNPVLKELKPVGRGPVNVPPDHQDSKTLHSLRKQLTSLPVSSEDGSDTLEREQIRAEIEKIVKKWSVGVEKVMKGEREGEERRRKRVLKAMLQK